MVSVEADGAELPGMATVRLAGNATLSRLLLMRGLVGSGVVEADAGDERPPRRPAVLLVDDDVDLLVTLRDMLVRTGCRVVTAVDGADGLACFSRDDFAVLVTDLAMPKLNGLQLARRCRELKPTVAVIMVTAWDMLLSEEDLGAYGVVSVLSKPVTSHGLRQAVRAAIGEV